MSAESSVGKDSSYFDGITRGTIFAGVAIRNGGLEFSVQVREFALKAANMTEKLLSDLKSCGKALQFLPDSERQRLFALMSNLERTIGLERGAISASANAARNLLGAATLPPGISIYNVKEAVDQILGNPFGFVGYQERQRIRAVRERVASPFSYFHRPWEPAPAVFPDTLLEKYSKDLLSTALDYLDYKYPEFSSGPSGPLLGSEEYVRQFAGDIFGSGFAHNAPNDYVAFIKLQANGILAQIIHDVRQEIGAYNYMVYETRKRLIRVTEDLVKCGDGHFPAFTEADLEKLRRLEDFQNRVIQINLSGGNYPVNAKLEWIGGQNVLSLTTSVYFATTELTKGIDDFLRKNSWVEALVPAAREFLRKDLLQLYNGSQLSSRKNNVLDGFRAWGGDYTVFGGQSIKVVMNVSETHTNFNAVEVHLLDSSAIFTALDNLFSSGFNRTSMSWGGKVVYDWAPEASKVVLMRTDSLDVAKHEFGHTLGLGDAYKGWPFGPGIDVSKYQDLLDSANMGNYLPADFVMNKSWERVTNNDIEMVILAFATGQRQNYQIGPSSKSISEALGKGN